VIAWTRDLSIAAVDRSERNRLRFLTLCLALLLANVPAVTSTALAEVAEQLPLGQADVIAERNVVAAIQSAREEVVCPAGPPGPAGERGPQGERGERGARGEQGPQGSAGRGGPEGPRGVTGARGAIGPTGSNGRDGVTGARGPAGAVGAE
jgi:hypothetical protein